MYYEHYRKASELADRIRAGEDIRSRKVKRKTSLFDRKPPIEKEEEMSDLDATANMIAMLRMQVEEMKPQIQTQSPGKGFAGEPTDVGRRLMGDLMVDYSLTVEQASGIVGSLDAETGGFKHFQEINPTVPGSKGGYGYAQWTGPRRKEFESWASSQGLDVRSHEANYGNLRRELDETPEGGVMDKIRSTTTSEEATKVFTNVFLRPGKPNMGGRVSRAAKYMEIENG